MNVSVPSTENHGSSTLLPERTSSHTPSARVPASMAAASEETEAGGAPLSSSRPGMGTLQAARVEPNSTH